jgi:hypothetical protein
MLNYKPNAVPLLIRLTMAFSAVFLVFFAVVQLMTGYTYILGKRGGFLLHGVPSLMVVLTVIALCAAALLTIVDHYDKRPNEEFYKRARGLLLKSATISFFAGVPLFILLDLILRNSYGIDILSNIPGLAENYSFYSPEIKLLAPYLNQIKDYALWFFITTVFLILTSFIVLKLFGDALRQQAIILGSLGLMLMSAFIIVGTIDDFMSGEVNAGPKRNKYTVYAWSEPAKFNAIILTHFALGGGLFMTFATIFVGRVTRQIQ